MIIEKGDLTQIYNQESSVFLTDKDVEQLIEELVPTGFLRFDESTGNQYLIPSEKVKEFDRDFQVIKILDDSEESWLMFDNFVFKYDKYLIEDVKSLKIIL